MVEINQTIDYIAINPLNKGNDTFKLHIKIRLFRHNSERKKCLVIGPIEDHTAHFVHSVPDLHCQKKALESALTIISRLT